MHRFERLIREEVIALLVEAIEGEREEQPLFVVECNGEHVSLQDASSF